jgi:hypothetical protein
VCSAIEAHAEVEFIGERNLKELHPADESVQRSEVEANRRRIARSSDFCLSIIYPAGAPN